ncbi:MAG: hypothetical protein ABIO68_03100 [Sphingomicrobium sp.]
MKRFRLPLLAGIMLLLVAGCDNSALIDNSADALAPTSLSNEVAGAVAGGPPAVNAGADADGVIPVEIQGRWGLTPADCTTSLGDDKGLLTVSGNQLTFYESRAVPGTSIQVRNDRISGNFNFTGEGQSWSTYVSLKLVEAGLLRTERRPPRSYTYAKC